MPIFIDFIFHFLYNVFEIGKSRNVKSKITSISYKDLQTDSIKIDILEETREEIQRIIDIQKRGERLEGQDYTNGNLNREI